MPLTGRGDCFDRAAYMFLMVSIYQLHGQSREVAAGICVFTSNAFGPTGAHAFYCP